MSSAEANHSMLLMPRGVVHACAAATAGRGAGSTVLASSARRPAWFAARYRLASVGHWPSLRMNISRVVRNGRSRAGLAIPVLVSAGWTAVRPTRLISMSAAVLSLTEIVLAAVSCTEIWVPSGSFWSWPAGRLLSYAVTVSGWFQRTAPAATAFPSASRT
jgi:hypothetical protein